MAGAAARGALQRAWRALAALNDGIAFRGEVLWKEYFLARNRQTQIVPIRAPQRVDSVQDDVSREGWLVDHLAHVRPAMLEVQRDLIEADYRRRGLPADRLEALTGRKPKGLPEPGGKKAEDRKGSLSLSNSGGRGVRGEGGGGSQPRWPALLATAKLDGILGLPNVKQPDDLLTLCEAATRDARRLLSAPRTFSSPKRAVQALDLVSNIICNVADAANAIE